DHNLQVAPSTYYAAKTRLPSARQVSDEKLLEDVKRIHRENYAVYGVRKVWYAVMREGIEIGRDQVARLMRLAGLKGVTRRKNVRTTIPAPGGVRSPDLVQRDWFRDAPDLVWVADFERHEALQDRAVMKGRRRLFVAADG
ncbi:MAG: IS3 family transposase, partial [Thioalkalivibrio sp.]|nr:IS3 family transposase [Thioalkalivibrio sp.]